ncbi:MAG: PAS domain-containing protein, partial [Terracidiphilus sp.]|nr:PAS domain-containing protein [Terracidiphilus sp.]
MTGPFVQAKLLLALDERVTVLSIDGDIEQMLGFSSEDFRSSKVSLKDRIHAGDADIATRLFCPQMDDDSGVSNIRLRHADGRIRCMRAEYTREPTSSGGVQVLGLLLQDAKSLHAHSDEPVRLTTIEPMMNVVGEALYFKNRNHVFTAANRQVLQYFSNADGDDNGLLGKTDYDLLPEEYADAHYELEKEVFYGAPGVNAILAMPAKDGKKRSASNQKYAIKDQNGEVIGLLGVAHDVSEQVEIVDRLRVSEESLNEAQGIAGLGSYSLDIGTGLWTSSNVQDQLFGIGKDYVRSVEGWAALVHPDDRAMIVAYFVNEVVGQGKFFDKEYRIVRPS